MTNTRIFGYADPLCARAGGTVDFMISVEGQDHVVVIQDFYSISTPEGMNWFRQLLKVIDAHPDPGGMGQRHQPAPALPVGAGPGLSAARRSFVRREARLAPGAQVAHRTGVARR